jgi:hypothetical protein
MNWLEDVVPIREAIQEYGRQFDEDFGGDGLDDQKLGGLLSHLECVLERSVSPDELKGIFYDDEFVDFEGSFFRDHPVLELYVNVELEEESLDRIGRMLGKPVLEMDKTEMEEAAFRMYIITMEEYKSLAEKAGIELDEKVFGYYKDVLMLISVLEKVHGVVLGKQDLAERIIRKDMGLGYFQNIFRLHIKEYAESNIFGRDVRSFQYEFKSEYSRQREILRKHRAFSKKLRAQDKIGPPELLEDRTIQLDITPYGIAFTPDNNLAVIGVNESDDEEIASSIRLDLYDTTTGKLLKSIDSSLVTLFDGAGPFTTSFQGSITIGSDGIIYMNGGEHKGVGYENSIKRFDRELNPIEDNESRFMDAVGLLENKEILGWNRSIFQVVEDDGVHYFAIQPSEFPKCYDNLLVATDGKRIIGEPLGFSPTDGSNDTSFDETPRVVVKGNDIYLKASRSIVVVDRSMSKESLENPYWMIDKNDITTGCVPSNHCVDPDLILWAVTQLKDEPIQGIKAYRRGEKKGEIVSHFYQENYPGGWAAFRSMDINSNGLLAYTDVTGQRIHFYHI